MRGARGDGERWSAGAGAAVVGAGWCRRRRRRWSPRRSAGAAATAETSSCTTRAEGAHPQVNNLFRRPAGLADGLALKEPALPTGPPWDSPQQLGSPGLLTSGQGLGVRRGTLAKCNDACSRCRTWHRRLLHLAASGRHEPFRAPTSPVVCGAARCASRPPFAAATPARPLVSARMRLAPLRLLAALRSRGCWAALAGVRQGAPRRRPACATALAPALPSGARRSRRKQHDAPRRRRPGADAAAVARVVYPGLTATTRPQAVVARRPRDWPAALAAARARRRAAGRADPVRRRRLAAAGQPRSALSAMHPSGAAALGGAQVIRDRQRAGAARRLRDARARRQRPTRPRMAAAVDAVLLDVAGHASAGDRRRRRRAARAADAGRRARRRRAARRSCSSPAARCPRRRAPRCRRCTTRRSTSIAPRRCTRARTTARPLGALARTRPGDAAIPEREGRR